MVGVYCRGVEWVFRGRKKPLLAILVTCLLKQDTGVSCILGLNESGADGAAGVSRRALILVSRTVRLHSNFGVSLIL